jgi:hypothetical protein
MNNILGNVIVLAGATVLLGVATVVVVAIGMVLPLFTE